MPLAKKNGSELLDELYARAGDLPCSVLAMATPAPKAKAREVARVLVGGVAPLRVERLAIALEAYVAADRDASAARKKAKVASK